MNLRLLILVGLAFTQGKDLFDLDGVDELFPHDEKVEGGGDEIFLHDEKTPQPQWPPISSNRCSQSTKLKVMYGILHFETSLKKKPMTSFEIDIEWNALEFHLTENTKKHGGVYIAYTFGMKNGPGGYFGIQIHADGGQFIFSVWDADRTNKADGIKHVKKSSKLAWPMDTENCKRNCQDCGVPYLKEIGKKGFTTGTKCTKNHPSMKAGDRYKVKLECVPDQDTINTADFEGFKKVHQDVLGEVDRDVTGSVWEVKVIVVKGENQGSEIPIGTIMFESAEIGFNRLGTFDEMIGCNKCNAIYHKDTRYGPKIGGDDRSVRKPTKMYGDTKYYKSSCKKYFISGSKDETSISFESGPLTEGVTKTKTQIW
ncbi:uncharacterized protein [Clytia hemisphaerica]|uniref:Uncharacterized protein n=1 Tax=Clytia hemisphaerica TaxID=252671 RepID=A0A7M6DMF1_9CNID